MNTTAIQGKVFYLGTYGYVSAMVYENGRVAEAWRTNLKGTGFSITTVCFVPQDSRLYASCAGHIFALDPSNGAIVWRAPPPRGFTNADGVSMEPVEPWRMIVGTSGVVACVNRSNGSVVWENGLPNTGYQAVTLKVMYGATSALASAASPQQPPSQQQPVPVAGPPPSYQVVTSTPGASGTLYPNPQQQDFGSVLFNQGQAVPSAPPPQGQQQYCAPPQGQPQYCTPAQGQQPQPQYCTPAQGQQYYSQPPPQVQQPSYPSVLLVGTNGRLLALDLFTGVELWRSSQKSLGGNGRGVSVVQDYTTNNLFVGSGGYILRLHPANGGTLQEINLQGTGYNPVGMCTAGNVLYAATHGELFAIDMTSGNILWKSGLPGCGYGNGLSVIPLHATSSLAVGIAGKVAIVTMAGSLTRITPLPSCGFAHVSLILEKDTLIASSAGHVYGLSPAGDLMWIGPLPGLGHTYITLATQTQNLDMHACPLLADDDVVDSQNHHHHHSTMGLSFGHVGHVGHVGHMGFGH